VRDVEQEPIDAMETARDPCERKRDPRFVECRGERLPAEVVSRPFWKNGTAGKRSKG